MKLRTFVISLIALSLAAASYRTSACTSAVISGRATPTGRPLLWKHRDTGTEWNHIEHFRGKRYSFTGLVNSLDKERKEVWAGANEVGLAIMNTASYNMKPDSLKYLPENEGVVMKAILGECATVDDVEEYLRKMPQPRALEANFGVIDAQGGAVYFEVWDYGYTKFDANDVSLAPNGYLIRSNYSFSGIQDDGMGYIRYQNAEYLLHRGYAAGELSPEWIFAEASRSFFNAILDTDLLSPEDMPRRGWAIDQDYIPRKSSSASIVIEGVRKGENPDATTLWCVLGYPPCGYAVAAWVKAGDEIADCITATDEGLSQLNRMAVSLKRDVFPITRGNGSRYMRIDLIRDIMGALRPYEQKSMRAARVIRDRIAKSGFDIEAVREYNSSVLAHAPSADTIRAAIGR